MSRKRWQFWLFIAAFFLLFLFLIRSVLLPFVLGIFTAYFLDPAADKLEELGLSRGISTLVITACFFFGIIFLSVLVIPVIASQFSGLLIALPDYVTSFEQHYSDDIEQWFGGIPMLPMDSVKGAVSDVSSALVKLTGGFVTGLFLSGMAVVNFLSLILITPVVAFYLLRDWDRMVERLDRFLPRQHADVIRGQLLIINNTLEGFIRGQLNVCLLLGLYYAIVLSLVGLKFAILIGLGTGMLIIFPYVGAMLGGIIALSVAFFQFNSYQYMGIVLLMLVIGQILESYFLTPRLVGKRVGLHPVWIIFGMLSGAALFGFVGVLLAVPATAVIGVLIRFALENYMKSGYYHGDPHVALK